MVLVVANKLEAVGANAQATKHVAETALTEMATLGNKVTTVQQEVATVRREVNKKFAALMAETRSLKKMLKQVVKRKFPSNTSPPICIISHLTAAVRSPLCSLYKQVLHTPNPKP